MNIKVRYITKGKEYRRSEYQMKQILIATHGKMASGIRYTAELIVGKMDEITTIDAYVTPEDNVEKKFEEYFAQHENDRIFVFTDLMGGSVNQKLLGYSQKENVTLITGTNLPVLMQVMMADDDVTEEEIQEFIDVSEKLVLTPTIMLTKAEQQALKELVALDPKTCMQQVPNDEQKLVKDILDKLD